MRDPGTALLQQWTVLLADGSADRVTVVGRRLLAAYSEEHRRYHDQRHLAEVLAAVDRLALWPSEVGLELTGVRLAAWFHDVVYDPTAAGGANEEASAQLAEELLPGLDVPPERVRLVAALVRATATHDGRAAPAAESAVLDDADLAILASAPDRYADYAAGVRAEYAHVPEGVFRAGRRQILQGFLDRPRIYRTVAAYDAWEATARAQVAAEVRVLS